MKKTVVFSRGILYQYSTTLSGVLAVIAPAVNYAWPSPYLPKILNNSTNIVATEDEASWCSLMPFIGDPFGAVLGALLVDKIGRKGTLLILTPLIAPSFLLIALSNSIWMVSAARFVVGFADGILFTALPMYIGEISEPERREFLSSMIVIGSILGAIFINSIGPYTSIFLSSLVVVVITIVQFIWLCFMPESPYYLIKKCQLEAAEKNLKKYRNTHDVGREFEELCKAVVRQEGSKPASLKDIFTVRSNRKACFIFVILCVANKFSGKTAITVYTSTIFKEAGSSLDPSISTIIYCCVELAALFLAVCLIKKHGKRFLFIFSAIGSTITLFVFATHSYLQNYPFYPESMGWLPLISLIAFNIFYSIGLSFGQVTVLSEIFPTNVKGSALSLADIFSITLGGLSSKFFQVTKDEFGIHMPFYCFATCCLVSLGFIVRFVPETKGKSLEEIQLYLIGKKELKISKDNSSC